MVKFKLIWNKIKLTFKYYWNSFHVGDCVEVLGLKDHFELWMKFYLAKNKNYKVLNLLDAWDLRTANNRSQIRYQVGFKHIWYPRIVNI